MQEWKVSAILAKVWDEHEPARSLDEATRLRQVVADKTTRWYTRYFVLIGLALLAAFCVYALPWPWMWGVFAVVLVGMLVFFWRYERTQVVRRRSSQRRFYVAFGCYLGIVAVLTVLSPLLFSEPPTWWYLACAVVVAVPFFVAATLENRNGGHVPSYPSEESVH